MGLHHAQVRQLKKATTGKGSYASPKVRTESDYVQQQRSYAQACEKSQKFSEGDNVSVNGRAGRVTGVFGATVDVKIGRGKPKPYHSSVVTKALTPPKPIS